MKNILDIGCGKRKQQAIDAKVIGVDIDYKSNADVIFDLNQSPWPFKDGMFDELICQDVLEHLQNLPSVMTEIHRISKPKSLIKIRTPHYSSYYAYNNPTHIHFFGYRAFDYFCRDGRFKIVKKKIIFPQIWNMFGLNTLFNRYPERWEQLLAFIFRAENLYIELMVVK